MERPRPGYDLPEGYVREEFRRSSGKLAGKLDFKVIALLLVVFVFSCLSCLLLLLL